MRAAGFSVEHSEAGLYLWATRGEPALDTIALLAEHGILAAPGTFYEGESSQHVRLALTATDERIGAAAADRGHVGYGRDGERSEAHVDEAEEAAAFEVGAQGPQVAHLGNRGAVARQFVRVEVAVRALLQAPGQVDVKR